MLFTQPWSGRVENSHLAGHTLSLGVVACSMRWCWRAMLHRRRMYRRQHCLQWYQLRWCVPRSVTDSSAQSHAPHLAVPTTGGAIQAVSFAVQHVVAPLDRAARHRARTSAALATTSAVAKPASVRTARLAWNVHCTRLLEAPTPSACVVCRLSARVVQRVAQRESRAAEALLVARSAPFVMRTSFSALVRLTSLML